MRFVHAELGRRRVHLVGEILDRAVECSRAIIQATSLGDFTISIFRALSSVTSVPGLNPIFEGGIARGARRHGERRIHRQPPVAHRAQRDIGRHQLGGGGGKPRLGGVVLHQHVAGLEIRRRDRARRAAAPASRTAQRRKAQGADARIFESCEGASRVRPWPPGPRLAAWLEPFAARLKPRPRYNR